MKGPDELYGIGEFSRMSRLGIKALHFYHKQQILIPAYVEPDTGYRHYDARNLETARVINALRALDFSLERVTEILRDHTDDGEILEFLEQQKYKVQGDIDRGADIVRALERVIAQENNARQLMKNSVYPIEEKQLQPLLVGGIRHKGRYQDCGKLFGQLGRKIGRYMSGKAMLLCYDDEYKEEDAEFEPCMPLKKNVHVKGVDVRELPGGRCITLLHLGPYDSLSGSYGRLFEHAKKNGLNLMTPSREIYIKGPGMIFKGNPSKYLTEIQLLVSEEA